MMKAALIERLGQNSVELIKILLCEGSNSKQDIYFSPTEMSN